MLGCVELLTASGGSYRCDGAVWYVLSVLEGVLACIGLYWHVVVCIGMKWSVLACSVERIGKYRTRTGSRICARIGRYRNIKCTILAQYMPEYIPIRAGMY